MEVIILPDAGAVAEAAADIVRDMVTTRPDAVLGLATGSTPILLYQRLVERHLAGAMSFRHVTTFNLDEYVGVAPDSPISYRRFMNEQLFTGIDIDLANTHLPECPEGTDPRHVGPVYEASIARAGGIDLQVLGIGANGHIGFNEPGSSLGSRTRVKNLALRTIEDNSRLLREGEEQPGQAITMGIGTILDARRILLLATGEHKARAVGKALEEAISAMHPASILQWHQRVRVILDEPAAAELALADYHRWVQEQSRSLASRHGGGRVDDPWFHPTVAE